MAPGESSNGVGLLFSSWHFSDRSEGCFTVVDTTVFGKGLRRQNKPWKLRMQAWMNDFPDIRTAGRFGYPRVHSSV